MTDFDAARHDEGERMIERERASIVERARSRAERRDHPQAWWLAR